MEEEKKTNVSDIGQKIKAYIDKGVEASKKGFKTAGSAISEFGDKSVMKIELTQLKAKLTKEYSTFGQNAYNQLVAKKNSTMDLTSKEASASVVAISKLLKDIKKHEKDIAAVEKKEEEKKSAKKAEKDQKNAKKSEKN